jgi:hypothetical protein
MIKPDISSFFTTLFLLPFSREIPAKLAVAAHYRKPSRDLPCCSERRSSGWLEDHSAGATPSPAATFPVSQLVTCPPFMARDVLSE